MIETVRNAWKIPDLRKKLLFVIFALLVFRLGSAVPVPFVNGEDIRQSDERHERHHLRSAGRDEWHRLLPGDSVRPGCAAYINSSIIVQLLTVAIPALERLQKEGGEEGRKKIAAITRYVTVAIAVLQGFGYYTLIKTAGASSGVSVLDTTGVPGWWPPS